MSTNLETAATGIDLPKEPVVERKAQTLEEVWANFDPTLAVDPATQFYIARQDDRLHSLRFELRRARGDFHAFLCGHRGSGKTTELKRLAADEAIGEKFLPIYLTIQEFGSESVHLSHDALMVEIGLALGREGQRRGMDTELHENLANWGKEIEKQKGDRFIFETGVDVLYRAVLYGSQVYVQSHRRNAAFLSVVLDCDRAQ